MTEVSVSYGRGRLSAPSQASPILSSEVLALVESHKGIFLDVGCSDHKMPGSVGMDKRALPGVDIVWNAEQTPWPLPDECCWRILASHVWEHLDPSKMIYIMNECHRIMKVQGQLCLAMPYPGSPRFWQDPTHRHAWNEATPLYFTPGHGLYEVYRPKPWKLELNEWNSIGDINIILSKLDDSKGEYSMQQQGLL
jgi:hypothetical protein